MPANPSHNSAVVITAAAQDRRPKNIWIFMRLDQLSPRPRLQSSTKIAVRRKLRRADLICQYGFHGY
jgi:hypothetical protein